MTSMSSPHSFAEDDTVYDTRHHRTGVVTHHPERGAWICLADPDHPDDAERRWHTLYGDLRPADDATGTRGGDA
ncbi:hypothetical protein AB0H07_34885 [Streptomyces sp. NPDC021354]|uniref:hypothetical protein n=1 Tax=Streptomyces sp. NPDC021354 TaxID=3154793 RepID=UPI0033C73938